MDYSVSTKILRNFRGVFNQYFLINTIVVCRYEALVANLFLWDARIGKCLRLLQHLFLFFAYQSELNFLYRTHCLLAHNRDMYNIGGNNDNNN